MSRTKGRLAPFVPLDKATIKTAAWKATTHGARSLYVALKSRYNTNLQGAVFLSHRLAKQELGSHSQRDSIARWFRELEYYGFIRKTALAHHGVNGHGRAPHYRLTEYWYLGKAPTRDFMNWDGSIFHEQKPPSAYLAKNRSRGRNGGATLAVTGVPVSERPDSKTGTGGRNGGAMSQHSTGLNGGAITSLTTPFSASLPLYSLSVIAAQRQRLNDLATRLAAFAPDRAAPEVVSGPIATIAR